VNHNYNEGNEKELEDVCKQLQVRAARVFARYSFLI
jgi:hypothetical protein